MPDASEHSNSLALELAALEDRGREDIKHVIFNAKSGTIYPTYTASQIAMEMVRVIRNQRAELNVQPGHRARLMVRPAEGWEEALSGSPERAMDRTPRSCFSGFSNPLAENSPLMLVPLPPVPLPPPPVPPLPPPPP